MGQAATTASKLRKEALIKFNPKVIEEHFQSIEFSFATFPEDPSITAKSIDLVVSILRSIEEGIKFFLSTARKIDS